MSYPLIESGQRLWSLHNQILYNVMYEDNIEYSITAPNGEAFAVQQTGKPLWIYKRPTCDTKNLSVLFDACLEKSKPHSIVSDRGTTDLWLNIFPKDVSVFPFAALYLPTEPQNYEGNLINPHISNEKLISAWVADFCKEALHKQPMVENTVQSLIKSKRLFCLKQAELLAMGMLIPVNPGFPANRLNLIYVPPKHRGNNFGRTIVSLLAAKSHRLNTLPILYVYLNNKPAYSLYRSLGFIEAGRLVELRFRD
ncbi:MAG: GNAT family N-acetyltransferase [Turicibacter sp.]|nr:GNAT family N-acetyltransferase [Turicibacter sp.]